MIFVLGGKIDRSIVILELQNEEQVLRKQAFEMTADPFGQERMLLMQSDEMKGIDVAIQVIAY